MDDPRSLEGSPKIQPREDFGSAAPPTARTHGHSQHAVGYLEQGHPRVTEDPVQRRRRLVVLPPRNKQLPERSV